MRAIQKLLLMKRNHKNKPEMQVFRVSARGKIGYLKIGRLASHSFCYPTVMRKTKMSDLTAHFFSFPRLSHFSINTTASFRRGQQNKEA